MRLLEIICKYLHLKYPRTKLIFIFVCLVTILIYIVCYINNKGSILNIFQLGLTILLILINYIWVYAAPGFLKRIKDTESIFDHEMYKKVYFQFRLDCVLWPTEKNCRKLLTEYCFGSGQEPNLLWEKCKTNMLRYNPKETILALIRGPNTKKQDENPLDKPFLPHRIIKLAFGLIWISSIVFFIIIYWKYGCYTQRIIGIFNTLLYITAMVMNGFSFYLCAVFVYFVRRILYIKNAQLNEFEHEDFLPSASKGFQQLQANIRVSSCIFLVVAMLFSIAYIITFIPISKVTYITLLLPDFLTLLYGLVASAALFIAPLFFLQRLLNKWKLNSRDKLKKMVESIDQDMDLCKMNSYVILIDRLNKDHLDYNLSTLFTLIVSISTIILNVLLILKALMELPAF